MHSIREIVLQTSKKNAKKNIEYPFYYPNKEN